MATAAVSQTKHRERTGQQDRLFFSGIALLVLTAVSVGFARTYFLAGVFWAKLANIMVHVHGALFTLWIGLLVAQVALVARRRTRWHMDHHPCNRALANRGKRPSEPDALYLCVNSFPALLVAYDLWTRRSLQRATICGVVLMIALQLAVLPLSRKALISHTIAWLQRT